MCEQHLTDVTLKPKHSTNSTLKSFSIIHIRRVPQTMVYHQYLPNKQSNTGNLLKTTKATICKATNCIS